MLSTHRSCPKQTKVHGPVSVLHRRKIQRQSESGSDCDTPPACAWLTVRAGSRSVCHSVTGPYGRPSCTYQCSDCCSVVCPLSTCVTETNWRQCGILWPKEICFSEHRATNVGLLYPKVRKNFGGDIPIDVPTNQNIGGDVSPASPAALTPVFFLYLFWVFGYLW